LNFGNGKQGKSDWIEYFFQCEKSLWRGLKTGR